MENYFSNEKDKKNDIYQPLLSRSRQIYRGPRNSEQENLEQDQLVIDIARLKKKLLEIENKLNSMSNEFYFHNSATPNTIPATPIYNAYYKMYSDATPSYYLSNDTLELSAIITRLNRKISILES